MVRARQAAAGERIMVEDIRPDVDGDDDGEEAFLEDEDPASPEDGVSLPDDRD